jgi:elongation factor 1-beta
MSVTFKTLSTAAGLQQLDAWLMSRSYVFGFAPTAADATVLALVGSADVKKYTNVARWSKHISSFPEAKRAKFASADPLSVAEESAAKPAKKSGGDDLGLFDDEEDELDLFGDDDEEDEEIDLAAAAAAAASAGGASKMEAKRAKKHKLAIARSQIVYEVKPMTPETDLDALAEKIKATYMEYCADVQAKWADDEEGAMSDPRICLPGKSGLNKKTGETMEWADIIDFEHETNAKYGPIPIMKWSAGHELEDMCFGLQKLKVAVVIVDDIVGSDDIEALLYSNFGDPEDDEFGTAVSGIASSGEIQSLDQLAFNKM